LRSAEAAGVHGVLFPTHRQAPLSPSAVKASAGAVEHLLLRPVDDLPAALTDLHARGVRIAGSDGDAPLTARQSDLRGPIAIVVGSEGQGLGPAIRRRCDLFVRIPMKGAIGSLNAAVAGSILLFEAVAQREPAAATPAADTHTAPVDADTAPAETTTALATPEPGSSPTPRRPRAKKAAAQATDEPSAPEAAPEPGSSPTSRRPRAKKAAAQPPAAASPEPPTEELLPGDAAPQPPARRRPRKAPADADDAGPGKTSRA
jgi:tRNA(Leu) C34 or U34 (ribose-2'-O)-methylase TrmL